MAQCDRVIHRYMLEKVEKCEKPWEVLMQAVQRRPVEERMNVTASVEGAWKAIMNWYRPRGGAERDCLEKISRTSPYRGKLNALVSLGILKSHREVARLITSRLPSEVYDVEHWTALLQLGITRSETKEIVRASYVDLKTNALEERTLAPVVSATAAPSVDPHALSVGGAFQGNSGGGGFGGAGQQQ